MRRLIQVSKVSLWAMLLFVGMAASAYAVLLPLYDYDSSTDLEYTVENRYDPSKDTYDGGYYGYTGTDYSGYYLGTVAGNTTQSLIDVIDFYYYELEGEALDITLDDSIKVDDVDEGNYTEGSLSITASPDLKSGTWSFSDSTALGFYAVKGGTEYALYFVDPAQSSGDWTSRHTLNDGENIPEISHFSAVPVASPVPEPASMLLLGAGLAGISAFGRRRRMKK